MAWYKSATFKVVSLGLLGVAIMMAVALSLAFTLGAPVPKSTVVYETIEAPNEISVKSSAGMCTSTEIDACPTILEYGTANDTLQFTTTVAGNGTASSVTVQVCYTDPYIVGRPWRKTNPVIGNDKQCGIIACKNVPVSADGTAKCEWTVTDMLGQAVYYMRALGADETGTFVVGSTNMDQNFQTNIYNGRTTPIIIAVIVLSCLAWAILIGGLIKERYTKLD